MKKSKLTVAKRAKDYADNLFPDDHTAEGEPCFFRNEIRLTYYKGITLGKRLARAAAKKGAKKRVR